MDRIIGTKPKCMFCEKELPTGFHEEIHEYAGMRFCGENCVKAYYKYENENKNKEQYE